VNTDIYRYLLTIEKTRNITHAAEQLHISQPALTKALHKQEAILGIRIFNRDSSPLTLTYAGERYFENIRRLLEIEQEMEHEMHDIASGAKERVRVGITVERGASWLPRILPLFVKEHPEVDVQIREDVNAAFERALLNNELDFCVSTLPVNESKLEYELAGSGGIYLISSSDHPLAAYADLRTNSIQYPQYLDPQLLNGQKFITLKPGQGMYRIATYLFEKYALNVQIIMQLTSQRTVTSLAAAGMGLAFTTRSGAEWVLENTAFHPVFYTVEDPMYQRYNIIVYKKDKVFTPPVRALIDLTRDVILHFPQPKVKVRH
jgi:LysR family cyn operon transcriptional activator